MSSFDTARELRMPGIVIERVYIDPTRLSTRMKNSVKSMLRDGVLRGGWSSKAKQLARKMTEGTAVMMLNSNTRGFYAPSRHSYSDAVAEEVCALIDADEALELMSDAKTYGDSRSFASVSQRTRERHQESKRTVRSGSRYNWCWMHSQALTTEIAKVFASSRSAKQIEAAEKLCDMIDNGTPIPITLSM